MRREAVALPGVLVALWAALAPAQATVSADLGAWRFRAGDDAAWKAPDLDDRSWEPIRSGRGRLDRESPARNDGRALTGPQGVRPRLHVSGDLASRFEAADGVARMHASGDIAPGRAVSLRSAALRLRFDGRGGGTLRGTLSPPPRVRIHPPGSPDGPAVELRAGAGDGDATPLSFRFREAG